MEIGGRIKQLRQYRNLSVRQIAAHASISPSMLSQIERNAANPSLDTLVQLAKALGVPVGSLFEPEQPNETIVRKSARRKLKLPGIDVTYELLTAPALDKQLRVLHVDIGGCRSTSIDPITHDDLEVCVVTVGEVDVEIRGEMYTLFAGDAMSFDSRIPHRFTNRNDAAAQILLVVYSIGP